MAIISGITSAIKKVSGKPLLVASKAVGIAAAAATVYDAHIIGKEKAESKEMMKSANRYYGDFKYYLSSDKDSATINKLKKLRFDTKPYSLYHLSDRTAGYVSGFAESAAKNLPVIGLSVLAITTKKVGKVAGALLMAQGLHVLATDVLGIGAKKEHPFP